MDFYQSVTYTLYARMETGDAAALEDCEAYQEAQGELKQALVGLHGPEAERIILAARRLADLTAQYFYRVGLQDGVKLTAADFPAQGIA